MWLFFLLLWTSARLLRNGRHECSMWGPGSKEDSAALIKTEVQQEGWKKQTLRGSSERNYLMIRRAGRRKYFHSSFEAERTAELLNKKTRNSSSANWTEKLQVTAFFCLQVCISKKPWMQHFWCFFSQDNKPSEESRERARPVLSLCTSGICICDQDSDVDHTFPLEVLGLACRWFTEFPDGRVALIFAQETTNCCYVSCS